MEYSLEKGFWTDMNFRDKGIVEILNQWEKRVLVTKALLESFSTFYH